MVGFVADCIFYQVGTGDFLNAFFSTVTYHLESRKRGSVFPLIGGDLYQGRVRAEDLVRASEEVREIRKGLEALPPGDVVWDLDDREKSPPWGDAISDEITSLCNYFVTSRGKDLFEVLFQALEKASDRG